MSLGSLGYLIKEGFRNVWNNRIMSIASVCVLISCLILTGAAVLLSINVSNVVETVGESNVTTVYLKDNIDQLKGTYIGKDIAKLDNIIEAKFYSKDDAIKKYRDVLGEEVFAQMQGDNNPLPNAIKVTMSDLSQYDETVANIMKIDGVDIVSNQSETAKKLTNLNNLISTLSFWVILALGIISLFIISNTIRMTMYARRFEISIMKSVGATNAFVRIPFVIEGVVIGLVSSIISTVGLMLLYDTIMQAVTEFSMFAIIPFQNVAWQIAGSFAVAGALIGALGGFVSIRKYLKKEGNEILGW